MNSVICGNALVLLDNLETNSVDMVLTDIPYGVINRDSNGLRNLDKGEADPVNFDIGILVNKLIRICKGSLYIFCSTEQVSELREEMILGGVVD